MCTNGDLPNEKYFGFFTINENVFDHYGDGSMTSQWQTNSGSIFSSFKIVRNIVLPDEDSLFAPNLDNSLIYHRAFTIISGNLDDEQVCYIYNSTRLYRINCKYGAFCQCQQLSLPYKPLLFNTTESILFIHSKGGPDFALFDFVYMKSQLIYCVTV